jgi:hypothetical protein
MFLARDQSAQPTRTAQFSVPQMKRDLYPEVSARIIAQLERGADESRE